MIYLGSDHGGFHLKEKIKNWLTEWGYHWQDLGNTVYDKDDDYPQYAFAVAENVARQKDTKGILCCRSAAGMVIAANRVRGARAVAAFNPDYIKQSRLHNDVNILALGADWTEDEEIKKILKSFLETKFSGEERHRRRIKIIENYKTTLV